jgi:hypothetical protein
MTMKLAVDMPAEPCNLNARLHNNSWRAPAFPSTMACGRKRGRDEYGSSSETDDDNHTVGSATTAAPMARPVLFPKRAFTHHANMPNVFSTASLTSLGAQSKGPAAGAGDAVAGAAAAAPSAEPRPGAATTSEEQPTASARHKLIRLDSAPASMHSSPDKFMTLSSYSTTSSTTSASSPSSSVNPTFAAAGVCHPSRLALAAPTVDDITLRLGIGWTRISGGDADRQAAARGWTRYIDNHFRGAVTNARILLQGKSLDGAFLVQSDEGWFLFDEDLSQARLVAASEERALENLRAVPVVFDGAGVLRPASASTSASHGRADNDNNNTHNNHYYSAQAGLGNDASLTPMTAEVQSLGRPNVAAVMMGTAAGSIGHHAPSVVLNDIVGSNEYLSESNSMELD